MSKQTHTVTQVTPVVPPVNQSTLKVLIDDYAFQQLLFLRDHKDSEVALFGITKPENPLHVTKFALVKQIVDAVAADCDEEGMADHIQKYINEGVMPINSSRFWAHTHPMTGENSANPSAKDMGTWNHPDHAQKNFFVMFIISKTGQITCRVRIKGNAQQIVPGIDYKIEIDSAAKVEIAPTEGFLQKIRTAASKFFTQEGLAALSQNDINRMILAGVKDKRDLFPEFSELIADYNRLVTQRSATQVYGGYIGYGNTTNHYQSANKRKKKILGPRDIPAVALILGEDAVDTRQITMGSTALMEINNDYEDDNGRTIIKMDTDKAYNDFVKYYQAGKNNYVMAILGSMRGDCIISQHGMKSQIKISLFPDKNNKSLASVGASMFWPNLKGMFEQINKTETNPV